MTPREYLLTPSRVESRTRGRADVMRLLDAADVLGVAPEGVDLEHSDATDARAGAVLCVAVTADRLLAHADDERTAADHYASEHRRDERRAASALGDTYASLALALRHAATLARLDLQEHPDA